MPTTPQDDAKTVTHLRSELDRFKTENVSLVERLNDALRQISDLEHANRRLERELLEVKFPNAEADLRAMRERLGKPRSA